MVIAMKVTASGSVILNVVKDRRTEILRYVQNDRLLTFIVVRMPMEILSA
jgi:hypothetical protein